MLHKIYRFFADKLNRYFKTQKTLFFFLGASFGTSFPVGAIIIDFFIKNGRYGIIELLNINPLHYIIMTSPLVLGFLSSLAGMRDDRIKSQRKEIESANGDLSKRNSEMQDIFSHISQGILTFNDDYIINKEYSLILEKIFDTAHLEDQFFPDLIYPNQDEKLKNELKEYLSILFSNTFASNEMLSESNPIKDLERPTNSKRGEIKIQYLNIEFIRILNNGVTEKVMVIITDQTRSILAESARKEEEESHEAELENIASIIKIPQEDATNFFNLYYEISNRIEKTFTKKGLLKSSIDDFQKLKRDLHSLKGECRLYNFPRIVTSIHELENCFSFSTLESYFNLPTSQRRSESKENESMQFSLNVMMLLSSIKILFNSIAETKNRIAKQLDIHSTSSKYNNNVDVYLPQLISIKDNLSSVISKISPKEKSENWTIPLIKFIERTSKELEKDGLIRLVFPLKIIIKLKQIKIEQLGIFKDSIIHLLQNSLFHGIEKPESRGSKNKYGQLTLKLLEDDKNIVIQIIDDGSGLNITKIKKKAGIAKDEPFSKKDAIEYLFRNGFSTTENANEVAGRGVGLSIVKETVQKYKGKISINTKIDEGTSVSLVFPIDKILSGD